MKKTIVILVIFIAILGIGAYFYNFYNKNIKYNLESQYQVPSTSTKQVDTSNEIIGQLAPNSFMLIGRMLQIRIDSQSKPWWGQATIAGGDKPNTDKINIGLEVLGKLSENPDGTKFYAKIFSGDCSNQSKSLFRLMPVTVVYGKGAGSQTLFEISLDEFLKQTPMSIQVYSDSDYKEPYACGTINQ